MAFDIIPKKEEKRIPWFSILFYLFLTLLIAAVALYFVLNYFQNNSASTLKNLEELISKKGTPEEKELRQLLGTYQEKINAVAPLLDSHRQNVNFFTYLEKITHPKVYFSKIDLNIKETQASLSGQTESFKTLSQQMFILGEERMLNNLTDFSLSNLSMEKDGKVNFNITLDLNAKIFR